jgi:hypothetical protein
LDEEALRVTRLIRYEKPAMQAENKPVKIEFVVPVFFKLGESKK